MAELEMRRRKKRIFGEENLRICVSLSVKGRMQKGGNIKFFVMKGRNFDFRFSKPANLSSDQRLKMNPEVRSTTKGKFAGINAKQF